MPSSSVTDQTGAVTEGVVTGAAAADAAASDVAASDVAARAARPGRPRSEQAEHAIIVATLDLFAERGVAGLSVEDVAARAGVGKATIYRRWSGKEDLLMAALDSLRSPLPEPSGGPVRDQLVAQLRVMAKDTADPRYARQYTMLHGEGSKYPRLYRMYQDTVVEPRRDRIRQVLRAGMASGELRPDLDVEVAVLALCGAVMARCKSGVPFTGTRYGSAEGFATVVVDELLVGFSRS